MINYTERNKVNRSKNAIITVPSYDLTNREVLFKSVNISENSALFIDCYFRRLSVLHVGNRMLIVFFFFFLVVGRQNSHRKNTIIVQILLYIVLSVCATRLLFIRLYSAFLISFRMFHFSQQSIKLISSLRGCFGNLKIHAFFISYTVKL